MRLLNRDDTALAVVDVQERLLGALSEQARTLVVARTGILIDTARILGVPIVATEQYPAGLGRTTEAIATRLVPDVVPIEKLCFSCGRSPEFRAVLEETGRQHVIVCGVESHVCVLQTAVDLINAGYGVYVPADAVRSRHDSDWERSLRLMEQAGAVVGTVETFVFQLLERAGTAEFKQVAKLIK